MSLLSNILEKRKTLNNCTTVVTKLSGDKFVESIDSSGFRQEKKLDEKHAGYIIDNKPDYQIAKVSKFLTFGSQDVASNYDLLINENISHILSIGVQPTHVFKGIQYKFIDLLDTPEESLVNVLATTNPLIDHVKNLRNSKIFIHCNAGCSRAPSIVIGYLMYSNRYTYNEAFQFVGDKRYIRPNDGFVKQLQQYEIQLSK